MKIFIYTLIAIALALIVFNITLLDFDNLLEGNSLVALIGIIASLCAVCILIIFKMAKTSKKKHATANMFDVLIIGGGVSGVSCALITGSAHSRPYAEGRRVGIFTHQKASALQDAIFYNAYGVTPGTPGKDLMDTSLEHLRSQYPSVEQLPNEKVMKVEGEAGNFTVTTNKSTYQTKIIVVTIGSANTFAIEGLMEYIIPHKKAIPEKNRIQLANNDHLVAEGIYVAGTLAGHRSQLAIAAGSGAAVGTDILTLWNDGKPTQYHDSLKAPQPPKGEWLPGS